MNASPELPSAPAPAPHAPRARQTLLGAGLACMGLALGLSLWLLPALPHVGEVELDIQTMLYGSLAIACGFQLVLLALLGEVLAARAAWAWNDAAQVALDSFRGLRLAVPAALLGTLGIELAGASFAWGLLQMQWRERFGPR